MHARFKNQFTEDEDMTQMKCIPDGLHVTLLLSRSLWLRNLLRRLIDTTALITSVISQGNQFRFPLRMSNNEIATNAV